MNIGFIICTMLSVCFLLFTFVFILLKEKAVMLISGFNTLPKEERAHYDKKAMWIDYRNIFLLWVVILSIGAVLSYFVSSYMGYLAFVIWLIVFFKDVHLDTEKAFGKYKIKS